MSENRLRHIAVIMDGNGRWAQRRNLPRTDGHRAGLKAARILIEAVIAAGVPRLTLFAFSNENWNRPKVEVETLLALFSQSIASEGPSLKKNGIRLNFIGDAQRFPAPLRAGMRRLEEYTKDGERLNLTLALGYSGRWDIAQAAEKLAAAGEAHTEENFSRHLAAQAPDLLIRSGGERRISNFMLWQMAYTELYFTDTLWPDFTARSLQVAIDDFHRRERRFGCVPERSLSSPSSSSSSSPPPAAEQQPQQQPAEQQESQQQPMQVAGGERQ